MTGYILRRVLGLIPVLVGISLLVFSLTRIIPADPALLMLGERSTPEARERLREEMGLNRPLPVQYAEFAWGAVRGDLGQSYLTRINVRQGLAERFPATFELTVVAMLFALLVGIPAGVLAALNRGTLLDTALMVGALSGVSFPVFWLAIILIYIFAVNLQWLPPGLRLDVSLRNFAPVTGFYVLDGFLRGQPNVSVNALKHLVLPGIALGTIPLAIVVRMTRSSMLEVLGQDYVRTARAKGLVRRIVVQQTRAAQRTFAGRDRRRPLFRRAPVGRDSHRDGLCLARHREVDLRRHPVTRLSHRPGRGRLCGVRFCDCQFAYRPFLRAD